jgi:hypothetical protein
MHVCPQCAATIDLARSPATRIICPNCGHSSEPLTTSRWIDVARVRNLAEAGFLCDELNGLGIDARIHQMDDFNAISDRWATLYLIRVRTEAVREAVALIRQHLAEEEDEYASPGFGFSMDDQSNDPLLWRPIALVILAGVASFVMGQRFSEQKEQPVDRRAARNSLAAAVEQIGRPLMTDAAPGQPRHRLWFDRKREGWSLEVDHDGDGHFDSRRMFHHSGVPW